MNSTADDVMQNAGNIISDYFSATLPENGLQFMDFV